MKNIVRIILGIILLGGIIYITWWAAGTSGPPVKPMTTGPSTSDRTTSGRSSPTLPPPFVAGGPGANPGNLGPSEVGINEDVFEEKLNDILVNESISHDQAANMLLDMLPGASIEQQVELSQHAANLLSDEQYSRIRSLLLDPNVDQEVKEVWYSDLLNRESEINLPILAEVAKQPSNPFSEEALDTLSIILDAEIAENPLLIDSAVKKHLDEMREEEEGTAATTPVPPSGQ